MKKLTIVWMLAALASSGLYAQSTPSPAPPPRTPPVRQDMQPDIYGTQVQQYRELADGNRRAYRASQAKLSALRARLAEDWQSFGMPKDAAQQVAAAYQPSGKSPPPRVSLNGKSNAEIATMLQSALAQKDFMLANQTLIEFERKKIKEGTHPASDSRK